MGTVARRNQKGNGIPLRGFILVIAMTYGYSADILEALEMEYMSEYEYMLSIMEEMERKPLLTHEEYIEGIKAIEDAERKSGEWTI